MMIKNIYILLIFVLGFTLTPNIVSACSVKTEKACCKKDKSEKIDHKNCCNNASQESKDKDNCNGKCGNNSCHCPTIGNIFIQSLFIKISNNFYYLKENQVFSYVETCISSGFYNIWSPPNIS